MILMKEMLIFATGCAIDSEMFYIACIPEKKSKAEDVPGAVMCFYQNQTREKWFYHELPGWRVVSVAFQDPPPNTARSIYALGEQGDIEIYSRTGSIFEKIPDAGLSHKHNFFGHMSRIRFIDKNLYACGFGGQIYRNRDGRWSHFDAGLLQKNLIPNDLQFSDPQALLAKLSETANSARDLADIDGFNEQDLYVVGGDGLIGHHDGQSWRILDSPTAANLNAIHLSPDNDVWIVGSRGTVMKGSARCGFKVISANSMNADFYSITSFDGIIYIGASDGIYTLIGDTPGLLPISKQEDLFQVTCVESKGNALWALSPTKLLRFDGMDWQAIVHPNNV
jgi:hypothetical protein